MIDKNEEFHFDPTAPDNHAQAHLRIALPLLTRIVEESQKDNPRESFTKDLAEAFTYEELGSALESLRSLIETAQLVGDIIAAVGLRRVAQQFKDDAKQQQHAQTEA